MQISLYTLYYVPVSQRTLKMTQIIHLNDVYGICIAILIVKLHFGQGFDCINNQTDKLSNKLYTVILFMAQSFGNINNKKIDYNNTSYIENTLHN